MSDVQTEKKLGAWGTLALVAGTAAAVIYGWPIIAAAATHFLLTAAVVGGAGAYVASSEPRREKAKSFFSKVVKAYKDAGSNIMGGWGKATKWAEEKEAAAKAAAEAPEAGGASPVASKEAANDFNGTAPKAEVSAPKPQPQPSAIARLGR